MPSAPLWTTLTPVMSELPNIVFNHMFTCSSYAKLNVALVMETFPGVLPKYSLGKDSKIWKLARQQNYTNEQYIINYLRVWWICSSSVTWKREGEWVRCQISEILVEILKDYWDMPIYALYGAVWGHVESLSGGVIENLTLHRMKKKKKIFLPSERGDP